MREKTSDERSEILRERGGNRWEWELEQHVRRKQRDSERQKIRGDEDEAKKEKGNFGGRRDGW